MSFPAIYGTLSDTYTSATLPLSLVAGQEYYDQQAGKKYRLFLAAGTIAANAAFKPGASGSGGNTVLATAAATDPLAGVNNCTGASVSANTYFWGQVYGAATGLVAASVSAPALVAPSGTAGTLDVGSAAAVQHLKACVTTDSGAGGATAIFLF